MARVLVLYYSATGQTESLAMAVAHGARSVEGVQVDVRRVPDANGGDSAVEGSVASRIPIADPWELAEYDGILFGGPVRMGAMCLEMQMFMNRLIPLWDERALVDTVAGVFLTTASQHGGHEAAVLSFHQSLLYHGMVIAGIPFTEQGLMNIAEVSGGSPWGAGTISAYDGKRQPTDNEFDLAEALGERVAMLAARLHD